MSRLRSPVSVRPTPVAGVLVFTLALGLRVWGIGFGLPELYHPDEPAYVLQALAVARGLPDGLTFADPPLFKYVLLGEDVVLYGWQRLVGAVASPQGFVDRFRADPSQLYLSARLTSAVFGATTALAAGGLAQHLAGRRAALLAAGLTAITFLLVRDAHFGVDDALVSLLVALGLIFCARVVAGGSRRDYLAAGALSGLAFAAKYDGIALLVPLTVAHVVRRGRRSHREALLALAACLVASVVAFPSLVTEPGRVVNDVYLHLYLAASGGYDGLDPAGGYVFYARALVTGLGWPLLLAGVAGLLLGVARRQMSSVVVASLPIALLAVLGSQQLYFARFALPALPPLIVGAALLLDSLMSIQLGVGLLASALVAMPPLVDTVRFDALLTRVDTRALARDWVAADLPLTASIAVDAPPLGPRLDSDAPRQVLVADAWSLFDLTPAEYRARGVEYVVVSSFTSEAHAIDPLREARRLAFPSALAANGAVVAQFRPYTGASQPPFVYDQIYAPFNALDQLEAPGPTITVYRLR
ncbi:MAG TPA: glycosyltransferase family 39 protein [Chloroflexota bacterium]